MLDREQLRSVTLEDEQLMREIVASLIDDTGRQMAALARAIAEQDAGEAARLAHYSKGACASVGALASAALLQQIERKAAGLDFDACRESLTRLAAELERLRVEAARI